MSFELDDDPVCRFFDALPDTSKPLAGRFKSCVVTFLLSFVLRRGRVEVVRDVFCTRVGCEAFEMRLPLAMGFLLSFESFSPMVSFFTTFDTSPRAARFLVRVVEALLIDCDLWRDFLIPSTCPSEVPSAAALARVKRVVLTFSSFSLPKVLRVDIFYVSV